MMANRLSRQRACPAPLLVLLLLLPLRALAQSSYPYVAKKAEAPDQRREMAVVVPYVLSSESLGFTLGLAGARTKGLREAESLFGTVFLSENESFMIMAGGRNFYFPGTERFFMDATFYTGRQTQRRVYVDGNPLYPEYRSGSHLSDQEDFLVEDTWEARADVDFKWVLPFGEGRDKPVATYLVKDGLLVSDPTGGSWLPWKSGRTTFSIRPQYWDQFIDPEEIDIAYRTLNFTFELEYDNRDFRPNPARGGYIRAALLRDWGWIEDSTDWTVIEAEASKHWWLGRNRLAKHQVFALTAGTVGTPSWEESVVDGDRVVTGDPPYFAGATLGGPNRMKAYPANRFHDRALVYYSGEYRMIPAWKSPPGASVLQFLDLQWWQFVLMGELGRVASSWDLQELHTDMIWDAGLGIRGMFGTGVGRMDFMFGDEGFALQAMFGQSF